jgi:hypothetical protein
MMHTIIYMHDAMYIRNGERKKEKGSIRTVIVVVVVAVP